MKRRPVSAAAIVFGSAVVFLATACGSSDSGSGAAASASTADGSSAPSAPSSLASTSDGSANAGSSATRDAGAPAAAPTRAGTAAGAPTGAPVAGSGSAGGGRKPCYLPTGYDHFFKLDSAEVYQGDTIVRVTLETCSVNPDDDEDVSYTPVEAAQSFVVGSGASVKILSGTGTPDSVAPRWLVDNKLVNSPHFYYRVNGRNQITAMEEIYHP
jgi:hypothetical protein